ncbi:Methionine aminopeptidase [BD1-7 clade bacterium]|uniref:Methionine aminopeptidase n=1 Tax=BD1-7 clade bacterium TaxID=2029982 RepID=A0A5S9QWH9_9GAMM|nr:Methionine aminopeptidase [BD1-7 clade bacterium]
MNNVTIKSASEIQRMRQSGALLAQVFEALDKIVKPGISTMAINDWVETYITDILNARPASKGQYDYPYALNASVNEVVCHGMPSAHYHLKPADIINIDITLEQNGYIADSSKMYVMPEANPQARQLVDSCYDALWQGINAIKPGATLGDIGYAIQRIAQKAGYSIVREYCGHGIGQEMHEAPQVMHFGRQGEGLVLTPGMTFTIEPMINQGKPRVKTLKDGWTVVTRDKQLSAQWEHTLLVTHTGVEVLTLRSEETHRVEP